MTTATAEKKRTMRLTGNALVITEEENGTRQVFCHFLSEDAASQPDHRVFHLGKHDGTPYRVVVTPEERFCECKCPGHKFRRRGGKACKHVAALRRLVEMGRL